MLYVVLSLLICSVWSSAEGGKSSSFNRHIMPDLHREDLNPTPWITAGGEWKLGTVCLIVFDAEKYPGTFERMKAALESLPWKINLIVKVAILENFIYVHRGSYACFEWPGYFEEDPGIVSRGFVKMPSVEDIIESVEDGLKRFNGEAPEDQRILESHAINYSQCTDYRGRKLKNSTTPET